MGAVRVALGRAAAIVAEGVVGGVLDRGALHPATSTAMMNGTTLRYLTRT